MKRNLLYFPLLTQKRWTQERTEGFSFLGLVRNHLWWHGNNENQSADWNTYVHWKFRLKRDGIKDHDPPLIASSRRGIKARSNGRSLKFKLYYQWNFFLKASLCPETRRSARSRLVYLIPRLHPFMYGVCLHSSHLLHLFIFIILCRDTPWNANFLQSFLFPMTRSQRNQEYKSIIRWWKISFKRL